MYILPPVVVVIHSQHVHKHRSNFFTLFLAITTFYCVQNLAKNMHSLASSCSSAMVALHIPADHLKVWKDALETHGFKWIRRPITVGTPVPTGWHPAFKQLPLPNSEIFYLFRMQVAVAPAVNMMDIRAYDSSSTWRKNWCSNLVLPKGVFNKSKAEIKMRPEGIAKGPAEEALQYEGDTAFNDGIVKSVRGRVQMWRREQFSQGVLQAVMSMIGRALSSTVDLTPT